MKLLRPVAGYTLYDHKKNDCIRHEIRIAGILDKIDEYRLELAFNTCKEYHKTESLWYHTTTDHKEGEQLEDRRSVGASSCNCGDGTDQRVQSLMFVMMMPLVFCALRAVYKFDFRFVIRGAAKKGDQWKERRSCSYRDWCFWQNLYVCPDRLREC